MGVVIPFRPRPAPWTPSDLAALDRLVAELPGATDWEVDADGSRAFVTGAEDETLLIVRRDPTGFAVLKGWERRPG